MTKRIISDTAFEVDDMRLERILVRYDEAVQKGYKEMHLQVSYNDEGYGDSVCVTGLREETDTEYERRLKLEKKDAEKTKKQKEAKLKYERAQYERLRKKFEGK